MSIIRVIKDKGYAVISNKPLQNKELSWEARGLLAYLLSKPDDWMVRNYDLYKQSPAGRTKVDRILRELKEHGHLVRKTIKNKETGNLEWVSTVYETPQEIGNVPKPDVPKANVPKPDVIVTTEKQSTETTKKPPPTEKPKKLSPLQAATKELEEFFCTVRGCQRPNWSIDPKRLNVTWSTPLVRIFKKCDEDMLKSKNVIHRAVSEMMKDGLTFSMPVQIYKKVDSLIADLNAPKVAPKTTPGMDALSQRLYGSG